MNDKARRSPLPWRKLHSESGPDLIIFKARFDTMLHPSTSEEFRRLILETPAWVNIVALTPERNLILVRQYRFGIEEITLEIPGGGIDPGEDSGDAAQRELREETGYTSEHWTYLGSSAPNPAFHDNLVHHWLAEDARLTHSPKLDSNEDITVEIFTIEEIRAAVKDGEIRHSLGIAALARVIDLRGHTL